MTRQSAGSACGARRSMARWVARASERPSR